MPTLLLLESVFGTKYSRFFKFFMGMTFEKDLWKSKSATRFEVWIVVVCILPRPLIFTFLMKPLFKLVI